MPFGDRADDSYDDWPDELTPDINTDSDTRNSNQTVLCGLLSILVAVLLLLGIGSLILPGSYSVALDNATTSGAITGVSYSHNNVTVTITEGESVDQIAVRTDGEIQKYIPVDGTTEDIYVGHTQLKKYTLIAYDDGEAVGSATFVLEKSGDYDKEDHQR